MADSEGECSKSTQVLNAILNIVNLAVTAAITLIIAYKGKNSRARRRAQTQHYTHVNNRLQSLDRIQQNIENIDKKHDKTHQEINSLNKIIRTNPHIALPIESIGSEDSGEVGDIESGELHHQKPKKFKKK